MRRSAARMIAALAFYGLASAAQAAPAIWEVSDSDSKIWLFGSVHLLPADINWRTQAFDSILKSATAVYFETDISAEAQVGLIGETFKLGINEVGVRLTDSLDPRQKKTLIKAIHTLGMPIGSIEAMKPWLAGTTLSVAAMVNSGYDPTSGVDNLLETELPKDKQRYFETGSQQIGFLAAAPIAEQVNQLIDIAGRLDEMSTEVDQLVAAWSSGQPERLADLFLKDMAGYDAMAQRLIYDRNRNWLGAIKTLLADNEQDLIVVGTGHLIGDGSVVDLLDKAGFTVKRVQ